MFAAFIAANGKRRHLGMFSTSQDAAKCRDEAAKILHGPFAVLNFPNPNS